MEEKNLVFKQVYLIFGLVLFAFVNVFLFDNKEGIGFSVFSTLTLLTIGLLSNRTPLRVLGIVSYLVNVLVALFGLNYIGWLTAVQAIELVFVVYYLYPKDTFLKADATDKYTYRYRWQQLLLIVGVTAGVYVAYKLASSLWDGSFLEFGGNTAFIFGIQYFLYTSLAKARANEAAFVANLEKSVKTMEAIQATALENPLFPTKKPVLPKMATNIFMKFAAIWLVVMDLSILSYIIRPNDIGFGIGAFFVLLSIIISLFVKTVEDPADVFSVIYHKVRPIQPVFFIILLIAHAHKFSYGAAYALLFALVYFVWAINKINMKTLLTLTILIYFSPIFGYISNPYRLGAENMGQVLKLITGRGRATFFNLGNWADFSSNSDYVEDDRRKQVAFFSEELTIEADGYENYSGIWNGRDYDLTLAYDSNKEAVIITSSPVFDDLVLSDLEATYRVLKDLNPDEGDSRYGDYYKVGEIWSDSGRYTVYLKMDTAWLDSYHTDPADVNYDLLILGSAMEPEDVNGVNL